MKNSINRDYMGNKYVTLAELLGLNQSSQLSVFIIFADEDLKELPYNIPHHKILYSNNDDLINQLLNNSFLYTGGDMTTVCSRMLICEGGDKIFESYIVLNDNSIGLQNKDIGWIKAENTKELIKTISKFDKYEYPILIK